MDFLQHLKPNDFWQTPQYILKVVDQFYSPWQWDDICPVEPIIDSLQYPWVQPLYGNPPYSEYLKWAKYAVTQPAEQIWMCKHDHSANRMQVFFERATALCLIYKPNRRVAFIDPATGKPRINPKTGREEGGNSCQSLIYLPGDVNRASEFCETFSQLGQCVELAKPREATSKAA